MHGFYKNRKETPKKAVYDEDYGDFVTIEDLTDHSTETSGRKSLGQQIKKSFSRTRLSVCVIFLLIFVGLSFILIFSIYIIKAHSYKVRKTFTLNFHQGVLSFKTLQGCLSVRYRCFLPLYLIGSHKYHPISSTPHCNL